MLPKAMRNDIHSSFSCRCCNSTDDMIYIVVSITDQSEFYLRLSIIVNYLNFKKIIDKHILLYCTGLMSYKILLGEIILVKGKIF